jgi:very-short-patch-repair endonuclease
MESEARLVMIDGGLPAPVLQYEVVGVDGTRWRLDFAWPDLRVAAEYDGVAWHSGPDAFFRDRRRYSELQELGWTIVSVVAEDVRYRSWDLVRRIETQLHRAEAA